MPIREPRCEHYFLAGLCEHKGCPHKSKPARAMRRQRAHKCRGSGHRTACDNPATIEVTPGNWLCRGCNSLRRVPVVVALALALPGCFGGLTGDCGERQMSQLFAGPAEGECMIVQVEPGNSGLVGIDDSCPEEKCVVLMAGENFRIWKRTEASDPPWMDATIPLEADGSCAATCE